MERPAIESVASKVALKLDLPPSCVQFCRAHQGYFVVGTYNLEKKEDIEELPLQVSEDEPWEPSAKKPQSRNGSLVVFKLDGDDLVQVQTVHQPSAILDVRFHHAVAEHRSILAAISSVGTLAIFRLDPLRNASSPLQHLATSSCPDLSEEVLFLQCNWHPTMKNTIAVTTSTGLARLLVLDDAWKISSSSDLSIPNSLEAWCIAFSPETPPDQSQLPCSVYSGGDDSVLRYTTCVWNPSDTMSTEPQEPYSSMAVKGRHEAGVTAILPLALFTETGGRLVVTGSYDDHIRVFAIHDLEKSFGAKQVELLLEECLDGGVWRLDLVEVTPSGQGHSIRILCSCMHAGAKLVEILTADNQSWTCSILARFEEHTSMNYGCDFVTSQDGRRLQCISTSFYDKLLCLWDYES